jgi:hypothetical protein
MIGARDEHYPHPHRMYVSVRVCPPPALLPLPFSAAYSPPPSVPYV